MPLNIKNQRIGVAPYPLIFYYGYVDYIFMPPSTWITWPET